MQVVDWPEWMDRTPSEERDSGSQFSVDFRRTESQLGKQMDMMEVDRWRLDHESGSGSDPGVLLRWVKDGQDRVVGCDEYGTKKANLRELYLWVKEVQMSGDRDVHTGRDAFAAAALPPGEAEDQAEPRGPPPHEVLEVDPTAEDAVVEAVAKRLSRRYHPDSGESPDREKFERVQKAKEAMTANG